MVEKMRRGVAVLGVLLGVIAIALALWLNQQQNEKTQRSLQFTLKTTCERQHDAAKQWHSVIEAIRDLREKAAPGSTAHDANFAEFVARTEKVYDQFPACVQYRADK